MTVWIALWIVNTYPKFQVKYSRDITKYHSFCRTTTTMMTPRLQQYLGFSLKTAELKIKVFFLNKNITGVYSELKGLTQKHQKKKNTFTFSCQLNNIVTKKKKKIENSKHHI